MPSRALRTSTIVIGVALALVGCLFPDLDELRGTGSPTDPKPRKDSGSSTAGDDDDDDEPPPVTPPVVTPPGPFDSGPDAPIVKGPPSVACKGTRNCAPPLEYCCGNLLAGSDCTADNTPPSDCSLMNFDNGRMLRCDGPEDCPGTQVCCFINTVEEGARCRPTCPPVQTLCHTAADCQGKACNQPLFDDYLT